MTEQTPGAESELAFDPEPYFNEGLESGIEIGQDSLREQVGDFLDEQGFDDDDIDELLYDPAPRRRGRKHRVHHRRHKAYDPAPKRRSKRRRSASAYPRKSRSRGKGSLKGVLQYAGVIAAGGKFLMDYNARAKALGTDPTTGKPYNILSAIQYDIKNFDSAAAMTRVQSNLGTIIGEGVAGYLLQTAPANRMLKGYGKPLGAAVLGIAAETLVKAVLDPPVPGVNNQYRQPQAQAQLQAQQQMQQPVYLPYGGF